MSIPLQAARETLERYRRANGQFGHQPAAEALDSLDQRRPPQHLVAFGLQQGLEPDQVAGLYDSCVQEAGGRKATTLRQRMENWPDICRRRADQAQDPNLAREYMRLAQEAPADLVEGAAVLGMHGKTERAAAALAVLSAEVSAVRGVSRKELAEFVRAERAWFTELDEHERPHPPAEYVTGLTTKCFRTRSVPKDPATVWAWYRAEADPQAFPDRPRRFAAVDLETASPAGAQFDPASGAVIEIGVVHYDQNGDRTGSFCELFSPGPQAEATYGTGRQDIHGITPQDVAGRPTFAERGPQVAQALSRRTLIAHNASFERAWIAAHAQGFDPATPSVDTLAYTQRHLSSLPSHRLEAVCSELGVAYTTGHRAEHDAVACAEVFFRAQRRAFAQFEASAQ